MNCNICNKNTSFFQSGKILNKYVIKYFYCDYCGFIQTEDPFWLEEAYQSPINISDTGILSRNIRYSKKVAVMLSFYFDKRGQYLDYSGGYGIFTRLMRDIGFNYYWHDPFCNNLFARGFEGSIKNQYQLVTAFEAFEHFVNPKKELETLLSISDNILFSTELYLFKPPALTDWWYYGLDHGQHVSIYSYKCLKVLATKYGLNLFTNSRDIHLLTKKRINSLLFNTILKLTNWGLYAIKSRSLKSKSQEDMFKIRKTLVL